MTKLNVKGLVHCVQIVAERWPEAVARSSERDRVDFFTGIARDRIPCATLDLESGLLTLADPTNVYRSSYPAAAE